MLLKSKARKKRKEWHVFLQTKNTFCLEIEIEKHNTEQSNLPEYSEAEPGPQEQGDLHQRQKPDAAHRGLRKSKTPEF